MISTCLFMFHSLIGSISCKAQEAFIFNLNDGGKKRQKERRSFLRGNPFPFSTLILFHMILKWHALSEKGSAFNNPK